MKRIFIVGGFLISCLIVLGACALAKEQTEDIRGQVFLAISFTPEEAKLYKSSMEETLQETLESTKKEFDECDAEQKEELKQRLESLQKTDVDEMFEVQNDGSVELKTPYGNGEIIVDGTRYPTDEGGYYFIKDKEKVESILNKEIEVTLIRFGGELAKVKVFFNKNTKDNEIKYKITFMEFAENAANMGK